jgi:hypothetical protein
MAQARTYRLVQDRKGMVWDLLLYIPTVAALFGIGLRLWYGTGSSWSYLLVFLGFFFLFAGANRILSGRLMLLPSSPLSLVFGQDEVAVELRGGDRISLVKNLRFYPDFAGKSFGLSGMDLAGKQRQFVFHRGQFGDPASYQELREALAAYK